MVSQGGWICEELRMGATCPRQACFRAATECRSLRNRAWFAVLQFNPCCFRENNINVTRLPYRTMYSSAGPIRELSRSFSQVMERL